MTKECGTCLFSRRPAGEGPCSGCIDYHRWTSPTVPGKSVRFVGLDGDVTFAITAEDRGAPKLHAPAPEPEADPDAIPECKAEVVNPKALAGAKKPAIWSVIPRWIVAVVGRVMSVGAAKYGAFNYRESSIACSTYEDAIERHLQLWFDGEDNDDETGVSHLASVIASCALLMDAQATGKLHDDRQKTGIVKRQLAGLTDLLTTLPLPNRKVN